MTASCGFLEDEVRQCSKEEGVTVTDSVENTWSAFENESQEVGSSRKNEKKCKVSFSLIKKNKAFPESYMKVWVKNLLRTGMVPARAWGAHAVEMAPTERKN